MPEKYDAIVIGAGLSGLAAGIRIAMFGKKVCLLEKHSIPGGLNSFYQKKVSKLMLVSMLLPILRKKRTWTSPN